MAARNTQGCMLWTTSLERLMFRGRQLQREISASVQIEHDREENRSTYRIDLEPSAVLKRYDRYDIDEAIRFNDTVFRPFIIGCLIGFIAIAAVLIVQGVRLELLLVVAATLGLTRRLFPEDDGAVRALTMQCLANLKAVDQTTRR
jgi:hypothetical protein